MLIRPSYLLPPLSAKIKLTPKQRALAEWRRIDLTHDERAQINHIKTLSNVIPGVLKGLGLERKQSELEILKVWNNLMDPTVVAHAKPVGLAKGTLFVNVDSN